MNFIARDSPQYAATTGARIVEGSRGLEQSPRSGGRVPEFDLDHIREIIRRPYRIIYEIRGDDCFILAVVHGSREIGSVLNPIDNPEV